MEEEFLWKYYSVGKTTSVRKVICEFTQGTSETFNEVWEQLRDLIRECPYHGVSNHEPTQIFYDGLGTQDRYLLDATSGGTFMRKYEDDAMELIETVVKNSDHNAAKPFVRGAMPNEQRIDKMVEVQNLLLDRLDIRNGSEGLTPVSLQEASPCANCSRFDHIKLDCPVIRSKGKIYLDKVHRDNQLNRDDKIFRVDTLTIIIPLFLIILHRIQDLGGTTINPIVHYTTVSNNNNPRPIKDSHHSSHWVNHKRTRNLHARPRGIQADPRGHLAINLATDADELMRGWNLGLRQDEHPIDDR